MKQTASRISLILTGTILSAAMFVLATSRPEYCGPPDVLRPRVDAATAAGAPVPTPAPLQKVVFVQIETDRSDIEIGWADN